MGIAARLLCCLPFLIFVLFPFFWVIITSFKIDEPDQPAAVDLLAAAGDARAVSTLLFNAPFLTWLENSVLVATLSTLISVALRGARRLRADAAQVPRRRAADNAAADHLSAAGHAAVHPALPDAERPGRHQHLWRADPHLPDVPDAVRDLGADGLFPLDPGGARGSGDDRRRQPALRLLRITLPLAAPALLSVTLFAFTNAWNEFLFAFVFITIGVAAHAADRAAVDGGRRYPALGRADGGVAADGDAGGDPLYLCPALPGRRADGGAVKG